MTTPLIYVLNMDCSQDRLQSISSELGALNLPFCRIAAIEGSTLDLTKFADARHYRHCHGRDLRAAEVGCYVSHLKAMEAFLATPADTCVILEDDARVASDMAAVLDTLAGRNLGGFNVLRLQGRRPGWGITAVKGDRWSIMVHATRVTGSTGYMLNRKAARRYLDRLLPMEVPFDHAFDRALHLGLRIGAVVPYPVSTTDALSTIETGPSGSRKGKVTGFARWTVMAWRAQTEAARAVAFLFEVVRMVRPAGPNSGR